MPKLCLVNKGGKRAPPRKCTFQNLYSVCFKSQLKKVWSHLFCLVGHDATHLSRDIMIVIVRTCGPDRYEFFLFLRKWTLHDFFSPLQKQAELRYKGNV